VPPSSLSPTVFPILKKFFPPVTCSSFQFPPFGTGYLLPLSPDLTYTLVMNPFPLSSHSSDFHRPILILNSAVFQLSLFPLPPPFSFRRPNPPPPRQFPSPPTSQSSVIVPHLLPLPQFPLVAFLPPTSPSSHLY